MIVKILNDGTEEITIISNIDCCRLMGDKWILYSNRDTVPPDLFDKKIYTIIIYEENTLFEWAYSDIRKEGYHLYYERLCACWARVGNLQMHNPKDYLNPSPPSSLGDMHSVQYLKNWGENENENS